MKFQENRNDEVPFVRRTTGIFPRPNYSASGNLPQNGVQRSLWAGRRTKESTIEVRKNRKAWPGRSCPMFVPSNLAFSSGWRFCWHRRESVSCQFADKAGTFARRDASSRLLLSWCMIRLATEIDHSECGRLAKLSELVFRSREYSGMLVFY